MNKIGQSEGFLGRPVGPSLTTGLPLMKNLLIPLAKSVLIPLGLTAAAAAATGTAIQKKVFGSGKTTLIISNEEMNDIIKIVKSLEVTGLKDEVQLEQTRIFNATLSFN